MTHGSSRAGGLLSAWNQNVCCFGPKLLVAAGVLALARPGDAHAVSLPRREQRVVGAVEPKRLLQHALQLLLLDGVVARPRDLGRLEQLDAADIERTQRDLAAQRAGGRQASDLDAVESLRAL